MLNLFCLVYNIVFQRRLNLTTLEVDLLGYLTMFFFKKLLRTVKLFSERKCPICHLLFSELIAQLFWTNMTTRCSANRFSIDATNHLTLFAGELNSPCRSVKDCRRFGYICKNNRTCQCDQWYIPDLQLRKCVGGKRIASFLILAPLLVSRRCGTKMFV